MPADNAGVPTHGLLVFRASRLEALLDPLCALLQSAPPQGLLEPAELITAHSGMRRWLLNQLAEQAGPRGIAANFDVALPGQWIDRLCRSVLPEIAEASSSYAGGALRWAVFESIADAASQIDDAPRLRAYLTDDPTGTRQWHLAASLAELFGRFLVYRPDWLAAWHGGRDDVPEPTELSAIWRSIRERIDSPHRSEHHGKVLRAVSLSEADPAPLHVFGISHLPPRQLEIFRAVSQTRLVALYCPDPCIEHWAGLGNERTRLRQLIDAAPGTDTELLHLETGHPLLANLGRLGQQFGALLATAEDEVVVDIRHSLDVESTPSAVGSVTTRHEPAWQNPNTLLHRVQDSIRRMLPGLPTVQAAWQTPAACSDASLRVHRCHSRLRELEALRDALLQTRLDSPDLMPSDIAVLAPSMADYAPLIGAVFGPPGQSDTPLPYHVADLPLGFVHPLHLAWRDVLRQAHERSTAPGLMTLLRHAAVQRALHLDDAGLATVEQTLGETGAALGIDAEARAEDGLPAIETHTLAWGLDRLCAGYAFGEDEDTPNMLGGLRPAGPVRDGDLASLSALHRLLTRIKTWRQDARRNHSASRWIDLFRALWRELFQIDPDRRDETEAGDAMQEVFAALDASLRDARSDPDLSCAQALAMLDDAMSDSSQSGVFLHGAITFCGMVPQRALPFRFVAVLGLSETDYPRRGQTAAYDPMPRFPRLGDRDVTSDDRYLFLETLMSTRQHLHLSWVGEDARSGQPLNASPVLVELLDWMRDVCTPDDDAEATPVAGTIRTPWLIHQPLHAFSNGPQRPDQPPRPPSFGPLWQPILPPPPAQPASTEPATLTPLRLDEARRWLRNPAESLLRNRWRLRLNGLEDRTLAAEEPLDARLDPRAALWRRLLHAALREGSSVPAEPSVELQAEGVLPTGPIGLQAYGHERELAERIRLQALRVPPIAAFMPPRELSVTHESPQYRLEGGVAPVYLHEKTVWLAEYSAKGGKSIDTLSAQIDLMLRFALLALNLPTGAARVRAVLLGPDGTSAWSEALDLHLDGCQRFRPDLERIIDTVAALFAAAPASPLAYFPKTTEVFARGRDAEQAWLGGSHSLGERNWQPGYAWLLAGDRKFWTEDDPAFANFAETAETLNGLIRLPASWSTVADPAS